ncbi:MAG: SCO family protein [Gammaproteobacteria bacterium]|nr:SCO family protein [Gammaproteobacteria bacterium]
MTNTIRSILLLIGIFAVSHPVFATNSLHVVVSIKPIHSIVSGLMQGIGEPELLVDGQNSPFEYLLTANQTTSLKRADLIIWVGPEMEPFLAGTLSKSSSSSHIIELLSHPEIKVLPGRTDDKYRDPWFWLDSRNTLIMLDILTNALIDIDPVRSHVYINNRLKMLTILSQVDRELEYGYRGMKAGVGYLYYDSLQYFEQAYALKIRGVLLHQPGSQVDTRRLLETRRQLNNGEFRCLLTESGLPQKYFQLIRGSAAINTGKLDSLGFQFKPGPQLYPQLMRYNTQIIRECLEIPSADTQAKKTPELETNQDARFILKDHNGRLFNDKDLLGKYQLINFGYTSCPDVCPLSLHLMTQALKKLGSQAQLVQPYFITIDPERDSAAVMHEYVSYFDPRIIGLTGSSAMIQQAARKFRVRYEKVINDPAHPENYKMDHSASFFLMAPDGRFIVRLASNQTATEIAEKIKSYLK